VWELIALDRDCRQHWSIPLRPDKDQQQGVAAPGPVLSDLEPVEAAAGHGELPPGTLVAPSRVLERLERFAFVRGGKFPNLP